MNRLFELFNIYGDIRRYKAKIEEYPDDPEWYKRFIEFCIEKGLYQKGQRFINQKRQKINSFNDIELSEMVNEVELRVMGKAEKSKNKRVGGWWL